jgi:hypothetical protein
MTMMPLRATEAVATTHRVQERQAGQAQREAFRQALQHSSSSATEPQEAAIRRRLQPQVPASRREPGTAHHVDVLA